MHLSIEAAWYTFNFRKGQWVLYKTSIILSGYSSVFQIHQRNAYIDCVFTDSYDTLIYFNWQWGYCLYRFN